MIIDSSAIIAILKDEPEARQFFEIIADRKLKFMGAPTYLETCIVVESMKFVGGLAKLDDLISQLNIVILDFKSEHAMTARSAFLKFGKGQGHSAQLNFGDCMCYAISKVEAMPLLFKGDDFRMTDVECAI